MSRGGLTLHPKQLTTVEIAAAFVQAEVTGNDLVLALANECLFHRHRSTRMINVREDGHATETGIVTEDHQSEHPHRDGARQAAEAGCRHRDAQSRQGATKEGARAMTWTRDDLLKRLETLAQSLSLVEGDDVAEQLVAVNYARVVIRYFLSDDELERSWKHYLRIDREVDEEVEKSIRAQ
jgi:hypothetical protein